MMEPMTVYNNGHMTQASITLKTKHATYYNSSTTSIIDHGFSIGLQTPSIRIGDHRQCHLSDHRPLTITTHIMSLEIIYRPSYFLLFFTKSAHIKLLATFTYWPMKIQLSEGSGREQKVISATTNIVIITHQTLLKTQQTNTYQHKEKNTTHQ